VSDGIDDTDMDLDTDFGDDNSRVSVEVGAAFVEVEAESVEKAEAAYYRVLQHTIEHAEELGESITIASRGYE